VAGVAPKAIARRLNQDGIAGPFGGTWSPSTIHGNSKRGTGVLNNELYVGRLIWNRLRYVKIRTVANASHGSIRVQSGSPKKFRFSG
jgi:hypothetical protein